MNATLLISEIQNKLKRLMRTCIYEALDVVMSFIMLQQLMHERFFKFDDRADTAHVNPPSKVILVAKKSKCFGELESLFNRISGGTKGVTTAK